MNSNWIRKLHLLYCANGFPSVIFRSFSKLENTFLESHTAWQLTDRQWGIIFFFLQNEVYIMTTRNLLFGNLAEKICNGFQISKVIININQSISINKSISIINQYLKAFIWKYMISETECLMRGLAPLLFFHQDLSLGSSWLFHFHPSCLQSNIEKLYKNFKKVSALCTTTMALFQQSWSKKKVQHAHFRDDMRWKKRTLLVIEYKTFRTVLEACNAKRSAHNLKPSVPHLKRPLCYFWNSLKIL